MLAAGIAGAMLCGNASAQDLSSQRGEKREVFQIPGQKIDHQGLVINPTPQDLKLAEGTLDLSQGVSVRDAQGAFSADLGFLSVNPKSKVRLSLDFGEGKAAKYGLPNLSGAYSLNISEKGISIIGYDERGTFYGLQTLRQVIESEVSKGGNIPCLAINDWPDLPNRGVVEGFYGTPWSHQVRVSLIDFYGRFKMNAYIYGPKDDPYHSSPNWRLPYPEDEAAGIRDLVEACRRNRVDFVWAIHPGQDIKWNEEDYQNLVKKFNLMYDLGVRHFAVFFDDISGAGANPERQTELLNRLTDDFVKEKGDVSGLTVCPTEYTALWANPSPNGSLVTYGNTLYPGIKVFWTGDSVCSDLTPSTLEFINSRIKRPAYFWWNYAVTDYARHILLQGPVYGLDNTLTANDLSGFVSNPMEHGEASKLSLYGVADYTWNIADYNPIDNWERGLKELMPDAAEAYRTFAIHSGDTETGYRRDESWETETFGLTDWDDAKAQKLEAEFRKIEKVPSEIYAGCSSNAGLYSEIRPWLIEFGKLGARGRKAIETARLYRAGDNDALFWSRFVRNIMSQDDRKAYEAHKSGTMKLQPFYENLMDAMAYGFLSEVTGEVPADYLGISSFPNSSTTQPKLMFDGDDVSYYTSAMSQRPNDWIGVDLRAVRDVHEVSILQGRNSVDDVDYFDHCLLECSADGENWVTLIPDMEKQYVINWTGDPVKARYVRIRRLDSQKRNYASVRSFTVNPVSEESLGISVIADDKNAALKAFDITASTSYRLDGSFEFGVRSGAETAVILLGPVYEPVRVALLDADGYELETRIIRSSYSELALKGAASVRLEGQADVYEIVMK